MAKKRALQLIKERAQNIWTSPGNMDAEITEESSFNMVRGFSTSGKDIRVKAQIKPGLIQVLGGDVNG